MSIYAVARIKQLMDSLVNSNVAPLVENTELCQKIENWMADQESKEAYQRELVFMTMRLMIQNNLAAIKYAGNCSIVQWKTALEQGQQQLAAGLLPKLEIASNQADWLEPYIYATTFILEQYQYKDEVTVKSDDIFLDCGACFGETAIWARQKGAAQVYAFEPNPNSGQLVKKNATQHDPSQQIHLVPLAVGKEIGTLSFKCSESNAGESKLQADGEIQVPVTTLDAWCTENQIKPNFIKMDLEGGEVNALLGAQQTIAKYKPNLAICLYHSLSDMWNIPSIIKQICPEYQFWCRKNSLYSEFVLYARI